MDFRTSRNLIISMKNSLATLIAFAVFLQGIKCVIFEYLSTTTKTQFIPRWVHGRPNTKSMEISSHICSSIDRGMYKLVFYDCSLVVWQVKQRWTNLFTSRLSWGQASNNYPPKLTLFNLFLYDPLICHHASLKSISCKRIYEKYTINYLSFH
jgi:hypothetical protein